MNSLETYIKNNHAYLGDIVFQIDHSAFIREPGRDHDLIVLCPNIDPINRAGNWFVEWGIEELAENTTLMESALAYCDCYGNSMATVRPKVLPIRCNNLFGHQLFWGDEYQQDMRVVFPHDEGLYFIHVVLKVPATETLNEITDVCDHSIIRTILTTIRREVDCKDITLKSVEEVGFSSRTYNALRRFGLDTIGSVLRLKYEDLYRIPGIGKKGLDEVAQKMAEMGFDVEHMRQTS